MQGMKSAAEFALSFRTLTAGSSWNELTLKGTYRQRFNAEVACHDDQISLYALIDIFIHLHAVLKNKGNANTNVFPRSSPQNPCNWARLNGMIWYARGEVERNYAFTVSVPSTKWPSAHHGLLSTSHSPPLSVHPPRLAPTWWVHPDYLLTQILCYQFRIFSDTVFDYRLRICLDRYVQ